MTTTIRPEVQPSSVVSPVAAPGITGAQKTVALLRIGLSTVFLWAFLDKLFGLGYSTAGAKSWFDGGSPTNGFLAHVEVGPLQSFFRAIAGNVVIDSLFMLSLLGVGLALLLGVALRVAAVSGSILLLMMWAAEWPLAQFGSTGVATGSSNPLVDYHIIFALALIVIAALGTASPWGLGKWWSSRPIVTVHPILR
jgi:thiosulfate dehydrogenase [quinone] large subunit